MNKELEKDLNNILNQQMKYDNPKTVSQDKWDSLNNIKQALQDKDTRIKELELSDTSKEESSIKYYNEMKSLQRKLDKIKEEVNIFNKLDVEYEMNNIDNILKLNQLWRVNKIWQTILEYVVMKS